MNKTLLVILAAAIGLYFMREKVRGALVETAERLTRTHRLIAQEEGLRRFAYKDTAGKWTIGIGHLIALPQEQHLLSYTTTNQAPDALVNELFERDISTAKRAVTSMVKAKLNDNQFAALVSLVFNIGVTAFANSTVLKMLNTGDVKGAADAMLLWKKETVNGVKQDSPALLARRQRERTIFLS
jgi:lysozyme